LNSEALARVRIYLWLGLNNEATTILSDLDDGHTIGQNNYNQLNLPTKLSYSNFHSFQMRAHVYCGRDMLGMDKSGLSDPFILITCNNQSVKSEVIEQTNNPIWNQTFIIPQINIFGKLSSVISNPPEIIIQVYDVDGYFNGYSLREEFMGKCFVKPNFRYNDKPPTLKWHNIIHPQLPAGDLLAAFELILLSNDDLKNNVIIPRAKISETIPKSIMPKLCPYTLEILYWGLRNIKPQGNFYEIIPYDKFILRIEIGRDGVYNSEIKDLRFTSNNFLKDFHQKHVLLLPENDDYKPHLNIRCLTANIQDNKLVGSFTVKSIGDYRKSRTELKQIYKKFLKKDTKRLREAIANLNLTMSDTIDKEKDTEKDQTNLITQNKKENKIDGSEDDLVYTDWWSKYYGSMNIKKMRIDSVSQSSLQMEEKQKRSGDENEDGNDSNESSNDNNKEKKQKKKKRKKKRLKRIGRKKIKKIAKTKKIKCNDF
jgi:hypothetical protein